MCETCGCNPPGNLPDLTPENRKLWCKNYISKWMTGEINADSDVVSPGRTKLTQFFNACEQPGDYETAAVTWVAFPKLIAQAFTSNKTRWAVADSSRIVQDEYLEWSVQRQSRNIIGDIYSVVMTCEGPEYWQFYASYQKDDCIKKIKELNPAFASQMNDKEFFLKDPKTGNDVYNPCNYWNIWSTNGTIIHLMQPNNTLSAEIDIAAQATVIRKDADGNVITDFNKLINCSAYGNPGRNSDPSIGGTINQVARSGHTISVTDPVALYIHSFDTSQFKYDINSTKGTAKSDDLIDIPDHTEVFKFVRGDISKKQGLRIHIQVPPGTKGKHGQDLNVSNIYDTKTKEHIRYGAQFADYIMMGVTAAYKNGTVAEPVECYKPPQVSASGATEPACQCESFVGFSAPVGDGSSHGSRA